LRLQDLSLGDKSWFLGLTLPGAQLRGKVTVDWSTGDFEWSDQAARQWFETELAKRHPQSPPPPPVLRPEPEPNSAEAALRARLAEIDASTFLTPEEKQSLKTQQLQHFYGIGLHG
jgi:hypothetical protein